MMSRTGVINDCARSNRAIRIPSGIPTTIHTIVATDMMASVDMVSSHMPRYPIAINAIPLPTVTFHDREPAHAKAQMTRMMIGQGVACNSFSNQTRNFSSGLKKDSIASPHDRVNSRKLPSIPRRSALRSDRPSEGNSVKNSIVLSCCQICERPELKLGPF